MDELKGSDHILRLPSAPVYLSIMKTVEGKPYGNPVWISFVHREELSLENENISSTLISLSKNIANLSSEDKGKVVRLTLDGKSYNIFLPGTGEFQISFVIVFEKNDTILVEPKHNEELIMEIVKELSKLEEFREFLLKTDEQISKDDPLYRKIQDVIGRSILSWDRKRVKYLMKKHEEESKRLAELARQQLKEQMKNETEDIKE